MRFRSGDNHLINSSFMSKINAFWDVKRSLFTNITPPDNVVILGLSKNSFDEPRQEDDKTWTFP